jgi:hypothetical protein
VVAVGYAVTAAAYWVASRLPSSDGGQPPEEPGGSGGDPSPSASAQRTNS